MKKRNKPSLTERAIEALTTAVARAVEDHRQRGVPLAIWRDGKAVSITAAELDALREAPTAYHGRKKAPDEKLKVRGPGTPQTST